MTDGYGMLSLEWQDPTMVSITTPDLDITAGLITAGFVKIGSDVLSLPVMSLKMRK